MENLTFDYSKNTDHINKREIENLFPFCDLIVKNLNENKNNKNEFLGWVDHPINIKKTEIDKIKKAAKKIRDNSQYLVVVAIGGSYLGSRAVIEALKNNFEDFNKDKDNTKVIYAGYNLSSTYLSELLEFLEDKDFSLNVISKSGTTLETIVAFKFLKKLLLKKYSKEEVSNRIFITTDNEENFLKKLALKENYEIFYIEKSIGGRYSVFTAGGLLPILVSGINIDDFLKGAIDSRKRFAGNYSNDVKKSVYEKIYKNPAILYAIMRNLFYRKGKNIEILIMHEPKLTSFGEWFKQLFAESEGKDKKGIFPTNSIYSTELHSIGQFIQDGTRNIFETVVEIKKPRKDIIVKSDGIENIDDPIYYLEGKSLDYINKKALEASEYAHTEGGVPNLNIKIEKLDSYNLGYLMYFFMYSCAISGYLNGVNPFNQDGVEDYKKNMFALLGKKGYEEIKDRLEKRKDIK